MFNQDGGFLTTSVDAVCEEARRLRRARAEAVRQFLRSRPLYVTPVLLTLNIGMFLLQSFLGQTGQDWSAALAQKRVAVWDGELWRLVTATFLHDGEFHLLLNMLALFWVGRILERILGWRRFLLAYAVSGISGSVFFHCPDWLRGSLNCAKIVQFPLIWQKMSHER